MINKLFNFIRSLLQDCLKIIYHFYTYGIKQCLIDVKKIFKFLFISSAV